MLRQIVKAVAIAAPIATAAGLAHCQPVPESFVGTWAGEGNMVFTDALGTRGRRTLPAAIRLTIAATGDVTLSLIEGCAGRGVAQGLSGAILEMRVVVSGCVGNKSIEYRGALQGRPTQAALTLLHQAMVDPAAGTIRRYSITGAVARQ